MDIRNVPGPNVFYHEPQDESTQRIYPEARIEKFAEYRERIF